MSDRPVRFSIVLPCYNEAENLPELLAGYRAAWEELPTELILVDNGSTDATSEVLARELSSPGLPDVRVVRVPTNRGYGRGLAVGLSQARGEFASWSHADMQCPPRDLFVAYHRLLTEPDPSRAVVKGRRFGRPLGAAAFTAGMSAAARAILGTTLTDINAQPKVLHRSHVERWLDDAPDGLEFDLYALHRARLDGLAIVTVPVEFRARTHGRSSWATGFLSRSRAVSRMLGAMVAMRRRDPA